MIFSLLTLVITWYLSCKHSLLRDIFHANTRNYVISDLQSLVITWYLHWLLTLVITWYLSSTRKSVKTRNNVLSFLKTLVIECYLDSKHSLLYLIRRYIYALKTHWRKQIRRILHSSPSLNPSKFESINTHGARTGYVYSQQLSRVSWHTMWDIQNWHFFAMKSL